MRQSVSDPPNTAPPPASASSVGSVVTRPEPGLARGAWEAPAWAFWVALAVVLAGTALYVARRTGALSKRGISKRGHRP